MLYIEGYTRSPHGTDAVASKYVLGGLQVAGIVSVDTQACM